MKMYLERKTKMVRNRYNEWYCLDYDVYADQFDDGGAGIMGKIPGRAGAGGATDAIQGLVAGTTKA